MLIICAALMLLVVPVEAKETPDQKTCDKTDECKNIKVITPASRNRRDEKHEVSAETTSHTDAMKEKADELLVESMLQKLHIEH
jgi:hypothetical protein